MANNGNSGFGMGMNQGFGIQGGNGFGQPQSRRGGNFDPREDADGFLNLYLPGPQGDMVKVGKGIPVRKGYALERNLAQQLTAALDTDMAAKQANPKAPATALAELLGLILANAELRWVPMRDEEQQQQNQGFVLKPKTQP